MGKPVIFQADLSREFRDQLDSHKVLAVDCEMMGLNPARDRLCVVQVTAEGSPCALIQIDENKGAPQLKSLLEDKKIMKLFHFARMDTLFLFCRLGIDVQNIYCTKLASRLARTYTSRHGLREIVREFLKENMDKTCQSSDWGAVELNSEQISYAAGDVIYLFELRRRLDLMLKREKREKLFRSLIAFLPVQRELDCLGYQHVFEHDPDI